MNQPQNKIFEDLYGKPCWNVQHGHGSFITLEFGQPILKTGEVNKRYDRPKRRVYVHGEWHLWIYCCEWKYIRDGDLIAHSESSKKEIKRAINDLDGQALSKVTIDGQNSVFLFDLGGRLETYPGTGYDDNNIEQWYLFLPNGQVISFHATGEITQK